MKEQNVPQRERSDHLVLYESNEETSPLSTPVLMKFHQLFTIPQPSQGSIYLFSPLLVDQKLGCCSLLFGTLNGRFTLVGFTKPREKNSIPSTSPKPPIYWKPWIRDVFFAEIGANPIRDRTIEVFSLQIFQRKSGNQLFIGVTFSQTRRAFDPSSLIRTRTSTASRTELAAAAHNAPPVGALMTGLTRLESTESVADHLNPEQQVGTPKGSPTKNEAQTGGGGSSSSTETNNYIHIYASSLQNKDYHQEQKLIAATGQLIFRQTLNFLPTHLISLPEERSFGRPNFVVGGGDGHVHIFTHSSDTEFCDEAPTFLRANDDETDQSVIKYPEFAKQHISQIKYSAGSSEPSCVTWISYYFKNDLGLSAIGFRDGSVAVTLVSVDAQSQSASIKSSLLLSHFGPILSICLFEECSSRNDDKQPLLNMLVCPSLEPCLVYCLDPHKQMQTTLTIDQVHELPHPTSSSSAAAPVPLSAIVADVNFDGRLEILVGFCDKTILVYKRTQPTTPESTACWSLCPEFCTSGISPHLPGPIHAMYYGPLLQHNEDALKSSGNNNNKAALLQQALSYLAVFTTSGLLVLQHDLRTVMEICKRRLR